MAPNPEMKMMDGGEARQSTWHEPPLGEEVVITGVSGRFPISDNVVEFFDNLNNKVNMVTTDENRWVMNHPEMSRSIGKMNNINRLDGQFFKVHHAAAYGMDPVARLLLENSYSAIYDAGINPKNLRNRKIGVYVGAYFAESERSYYIDRLHKNGLGLVGAAKAMYANRISYFLGTTGPSFTMEGATASTALALERAYTDMRTGQCEGAIVAGGFTFLRPQTLVHLHRLGYMTNGDKSKVFDKNADGSNGGEATGVIFLQKARDANRIYCQVFHAMTDVRGAAQTDIMKRPARNIVSFLNDFYSLTGVSPHMVNYVEAYGCGVPQMDKEELEALEKVFCKDRKIPLMVGAVASNMGFSYPASGIVGLIKLIGAYHMGKLPGNLHLEDPHDVEALQDGRMRILNDTTAFPGGYAALNSFTYTGINVHILLKEFKPQHESVEKHEIPWLVTASGRTEATVEILLKELLNKPIDPGQILMLHNIHKDEISGHMARGYILMNEKVTEEGRINESLAMSQEYYGGDRRPVWFVYSGMGSQWPAMAAHLMAIPIFREAIIRCHEILKPKGLDLIRIVTEPDPKMFDNILHSFVGIAAVQIGLTDLLWALGIQPDNIIGHSVGELGCAYADGCVTAEEMILSAYSRGLVSVQTPFIFGSMAAVGIGYKQMEVLRPPEIEVACHNGPDSCTISGPAQDMKVFVADLVAQGIFAKEVPCSNIAYHSRYIAEAGPVLLKYLREVISTPKKRTSRWLSTSVPKERWQEPDSMFSSAEYHTNNLLSPVLFEETSRSIPSNAITIEIAPHGLLQAILRRSLNERCTNIALTKRGHKNNAEFFLNAIGELYKLGLDPDLSKIYPRIPLPVPAQTKTLSHLVRWEYSEDWTRTIYSPNYKVNSGERFFSMSLYDEGYEYLSGCVIDGVNVFPEAAQLVLVWETMGMIVGIPFTQLSVVFSDVRFEAQIVIKKTSTLDMSVMIQRGSGKFELALNGCKVSSGQITMKKPNFKSLQAIVPEPVMLNQRDIYQIFRTKGYSYRDEFKSICQSNINFDAAKVIWRNNWVTFLDSMLQLNHLSQNYRDVSRIKSIYRISINTKEHFKRLPSDKEIEIGRDCVYGITRSAGVEIKDIVIAKELKDKYPAMLLHTKKFVPFVQDVCDKANEALQTTIELALENASDIDFRIVDLTLEDSLIYVLENMPKTDINIKFERIAKKQIILKPRTIENADLLIVPKGENKTVLEEVEKELKAGAFVILFENKKTKTNILPNFDMIASTEVSGIKIMLVRKKRNSSRTIIEVPSDGCWGQVEIDVDNAFKSGATAVLVSNNLNDLEKLNELRREKKGKINIVVVDKQNCQGFNIKEPIHLAHIQKGLAVNVLKEGVWGSYRRIVTIPQYVAPEHVQLTVAEPGNLNSLIWTEASPPEGELLVQVDYAHVTSYDVKKMIDVIDQDSHNAHVLGMSFSGRTFSGERAMGIAVGGALRSVACAHPDLVWPVPAHWSLEDAATVPQPYVFAYYALMVKGRLNRGSRVLVHEGLSPVGQAAINICLAADCEVFTTVSSMSQKHLLLKLYPKIKGSHVSSCRDDSFELVVNTLTEGKGCNLILNTLSGSVKVASLRCVGASGTFVDLNVEEPFAIGMSYFWLERVYASANTSNILDTCSSEANTRKKLRHLIRIGISEGTVRPLSRIVFEPREVSSACRTIAVGRIRAAILLNITPSSAIHQQSVTPALTMSPTQSCLLVSMDDDPALSVELIDRILQAGAKNIIYNSLKPMTKEFMAVKMREWEDSGVSVELSSMDLSSVEKCRQLLVLARKPLAGLIVAGLEADAATATTLMDNLHLASTTICPQIQHFAFIGREGAITSTETRLRQGLPVITLQPMMNHIQKADKISRMEPSKKEITVILNTLEALLATGSRGLYTCTPAEDIADINNFLQRLESILGTDIFKNKDDTLSLEELGVSERMAQQLEILLMKSFHITVTHSKLLEKSLKEFRELLSIFSRKQHQPKGLRMFFTQPFQDEIKVIDHCVIMPTLLSDGTETEETFNRYEEYMVVIPGLENHSATMLEVCKRLKLRAFVHQLPIEHHDDDYQRIAQRMLKVNIILFYFTKTCHVPPVVRQMGYGLGEAMNAWGEINEMLRNIKIRLRPGARFHLVGYSFGAGVALAIARLLEELGHQGKVYCIDGSPSMMRTLFESELSDILHHDFGSKLETEVAKLVDERIMENSNAGNSKQYRNDLIYAFTARIKAAMQPWNLTEKLKSEIILIRASNSVETLRVSHDYGLQALSQRRIKVYDLDADHNSCLTHPKICDVINRELDSDIKELFNKKNLCQRYILAAIE